MEYSRQNKKKKNVRKKDKQRGEYKVIFKGCLLAGFDRQQVIDNIVQLTKLPAEKIQQKFFTGKVVIIRRAHDVKYAQKLQQLFTQAGLEVFVLRDTSREQNVDVKIEKNSKKEFIKKELNKTIKSRKRPLLAAFLWLLLAVILVNVWQRYSVNTDVPEEVLLMESALANKPLLFLAHVNVKRLLSMPAHLLNSASAPRWQIKLMKQFNAAGVKAEAFEQIISAAYIEQQALTYQLMILGDFSIAPVKIFLIKHFHGQVIADDHFSRLKISIGADDACAQEQLMEVSIEPGRIYISSIGALDDLHQLLKQKADNSRDISDWQHYQKDKLMSLLIFNAAQIKAAAMTHIAPDLASMVVQSSRKNTALESIYAALSVPESASSAQFDIVLNSKDSAWLAQTVNDLQAQKAELKIKTQGLTHLPLLLDKLVIQFQPAVADVKPNEHIMMQLMLDEQLQESLPAAVTELAEQFLLIKTDRQNHVTRAGIREKIDKHPLRFWPQYRMTKLSVYDEELEPSFKPVWLEGPFAIAVESLLLAAESDQIVIALLAKAQNIENIGAEQVQLSITSVADKQGGNLLAGQACQEAKLINSAYFTRHSGAQSAAYKDWQAQVKVKLAKGVHFSQVQSLHGLITLNLATRTHTLEFAKSKSDKVLANFGSRLYFVPSQADTLRFSSFGEEQKVLAVRALNAQRQYLSVQSSKRSIEKNLLAAGHSFSQQYQGDIAFIEVIYAAEFSSREYPVNIDKLPPYPSADNWQFELQKVKLSSLKRWDELYQQPLEEDFSAQDESSWQGGPLNLSLYNLHTSQLSGTRGQLLITTPVIDELRHNLSALEIVFQQPQAKDKKSYFYPLKAIGHYQDGEFVLAPEINSMQGQFVFSLAYNNEQKPLTHINGEAIIHLPVSKHRSSFTDMSIGAQWQDEGLRLKIVRLAHELMEFKVLSNRSRLLQISLLNAEDKRISETEIAYGFQPSSGLNSASGNIIVRYRGTPVKALLTVSEGQQIRRYPFELQAH